jgi:hypothetical protein
VPSTDRLSVAMTKSAPCATWKSMLDETMSASSRTSNVITNFIAAGSWAAPPRLSDP